MGPAQAIRTGFAKSFQFSGRASQSEFWWFAPIGLALPIAAFLIVRLCWPDQAVTTNMLTASLLLIPQVSLTARRLTDSGMDQSDLHAPLGAFIIFLLALCLTQSAFEWSSRLIEQAGSPGGFGLALIFIPIALSLLALDAGIFFFGLFTGASLLGQMAVASQPSVSTYGPNPLEVPK